MQTLCGKEQVKPALKLKGRRFERLLVMRRVKNINGYTVWECRCDCGEKKIVRGVNLVNSRVRSCGCLMRARASAANTTHGKSSDRVYEIWSGMMARCYRTTKRDFHRYGGRGIYVCRRWHKFENFYADMGDPPVGLTIERENNDGPYTKKNCCWASRMVQGSNTSRTIKVNLNGETMSLRRACEVSGKKYETVYMRIYRGTPVKKAFAQ